MTTILSRKVKRQTSTLYGERVALDGRSYGKLRPIVVEITPDGLIGLRRGGLRSTLYISIGDLMNHLEIQEAKAILNAKRKAKKEGRSARR